MTGNVKPGSGTVSAFHSPSKESSLGEERGEPAPAVETSDPPASGRINQARTNEPIFERFLSPITLVRGALNPCATLKNI